MSDPTLIARAYLDTWNETDGSRRAALLARHWAADAAYTDPLMAARGAAEISGLVGAVHQRFPGFRFQSTGAADGHGPYVRLSWALGPEGGEAPIEGSDVVRIEGGRIQEVIGFIDRAPAPA
jgi:hypothetical protein